MTNANELFKLRNQIRYCAESGNFYWMKTVYDPIDGSFHGVVDADATPIKAYRATNGYLYIKAGGKKHLAHRLAWVLSTGHWPKNHFCMTPYHLGDTRRTLAHDSTKGLRMSTGNRNRILNDSLSVKVVTSFIASVKLCV